MGEHDYEPSSRFSDTLSGDRKGEAILPSQDSEWAFERL